MGEVFIEETMWLHGVAKSIVTTGTPSSWVISGRRYSNSKIPNLNEMSSAYHLQTDGQTKVTNSCFEIMRCFAAEQPKSWSFWILWLNYGIIPLTMFRPHNSFWSGMAGNHPLFWGFYLVKGEQRQLQEKWLILIRPWDSSSTMYCKLRTTWRRLVRAEGISLFKWGNRSFSNLDVTDNKPCLTELIKN